jgi:hypothetical protein
MADQQLCVCQEPTCPGNEFGKTCPYLPMNEEGVKSLDPLTALIEVVEPLLEDLHEAGLDTNDHEQEEEYGELYPDVRRLYATIAYAKHAQGKPL